MDGIMCTCTKHRRKKTKQTNVDRDQLAHYQNSDFLGHGFRIICPQPSGALVDIPGAQRVFELQARKFPKRLTRNMHEGNYCACMEQT